MLARFLYKSYTLFYSLSHWRKQHITSAGMMMTGVVFLCGLFGLNILKTSLYQMMSLAVCCLGFSFFASLLPFGFKVKIKRYLPGCVTAGEKASYEIQITNLSSRIQKGLVLFENVSDPRPSLETLLKIKEPLEHRRNIWDRKVLYYRWKWLIRKNTNAFIQSVKLPDIPAGESIRVCVKILPAFRGYVHFSGISFGRPDVLGLFNRLVHVRAPEKLLVLPGQIKVEIPEHEFRRQYHPGGIQRASSIGNSDEFMGLRPYRPGDPLRNVHWKSFAKTRELVVKEFEDEFFKHHVLILDRAADAKNYFMFETAVSIASYCMCSLNTQDSIMDFMFSSDRVFSFSSGRGLGNTDKMLEILAGIESDKNADISDMVPALQGNIRHFSSAVCIFLDWKSGHKKILDIFRQSLLPVHIFILAEDETQVKTKVLKDVGTLAGIRIINHGLLWEDF